MKKKVKSEVMEYKFTIKEDISKKNMRWLICPHCEKPVYGTLMGESFYPNEDTVKEVAKWTWTPPKTKDQNQH